MSRKREKVIIGTLLAGLAAAFFGGWLMAANDRLTLESLGYPRCAFLSLFGKPCPLCGGYTSFTAALRGDLAASWRANPFVTLLLGSLVVLAALLLAFLFLPAGIRTVLRSPVFVAIVVLWALLMLVVLVFSWIARLI